ncbi:hypothetical protein V8C37DRAFT_280129 [Trichoderma ceciliae]
MDPHSQHNCHENPHFYAIDIILAYLNRGNTAHEIAHLSSIASAWCQEYLPHDHALMHLDQVLWAHPFLFDLSILSFSRLYAFNDCGRRNKENIRLGQRTPFAPLPHIRPLITAQQYFCAMIDAYTLCVGRQGRWFHDHVVAQDLKGLPILHYIPEVIHRIAALNVCELLTSEFSTFSPKTCLSFSRHLAKGAEIMMMDAPPLNYFDSHQDEDVTDVMDIDDDGQGSRQPQNGLFDALVDMDWQRTYGLKRQRSCRSNRWQPWGGTKKRKTKHE